MEGGALHIICFLLFYVIQVFIFQLKYLQCTIFYPVSYNPPPHQVQTFGFRLSVLCFTTICTTIHTYSCDRGLTRCMFLLTSQLSTIQRHAALSRVSKPAAYKYQIWIISIRRPGRSRRLPHHLLNSLAVDLWDESRPPRRRHSGRSVDSQPPSIEKFFNFSLKYNSIGSIDTQGVNKAPGKSTEQHFWPGEESWSENWPVLHFRRSSFYSSLLLLNNE